MKFIGGVLSVGGGASLGREGPSVQLGGGLASKIAGALGEPQNQRRPAVAAGAAAGLAAAFNTPIAAVTFVLKEIIGDLNSRLLGGGLLASVVGALVVHGLLGKQPVFTLKAIASPTAWGFAATPVVALLASVAGCLFQHLSLSIRRWNKAPRRRPERRAGHPAARPEGLAGSTREPYRQLPSRDRARSFTGGTEIIAGRNTIRPLPGRATRGVTVDSKGAVPVADDGGNVVWRVTPAMGQ